MITTWNGEPDNTLHEGYNDAVQRDRFDKLSDERREQIESAFKNSEVTFTINQGRGITYRNAHYES